MKRLMPVLFALSLLTGCGATTPEYTAPQPSAESVTTSVIMDESYNEAWDKLINFTSARFFAIDNYEKESGLMTLSFSSDPARYVDCGTVGTGSDQQGWIEWWRGTNSTASVSLDGRMNLTVQKVSRAETKVEVNTRYVVTAESNLVVNQNYEWVFNTGGSDTVPKAPPAGMSGGPRTCTPTHEAEKVIVEGILES
jgi:hypothetical protein